MARKTKTEGATGTVQARHAAELERQKAARALRDLEIENTKAAQKATDKRISTKPTDTRTLVDPDPAAGIL